MTTAEAYTAMVNADHAVTQYLKRDNIDATLLLALIRHADEKMNDYRRTRVTNVSLPTSRTAKGN